MFAFPMFIVSRGSCVSNHICLTTLVATYKNYSRTTLEHLFNMPWESAH